MMGRLETDQEQFFIRTASMNGFSPIAWFASWARSWIGAGRGLNWRRIATTRGGPRSIPK